MSAHAHSPMKLLLRIPAFALVGLAALAFCACDSDESGGGDMVVFDGLTYIATGEAELEVTTAGLVVSNIGPSGDDGVRVERPAGLRSADVDVQPVVIPNGARWGLQVFGEVAGERTALAAAWADGAADSRHEINVEYADALGVTLVAFEYLLGGSLVYRSPDVPLDGTNRSRAAASAGASRARPGSTHAQRSSKGVIVVGTDYASDAALRGGGCTAALVETPFPVGEVCTDFVRAIPLVAALYPEVTDLELTGRDIGSFTVTSATGIE